MLIAQGFIQSQPYPSELPHELSMAYLLDSFNDYFYWKNMTRILNPDK